MDIKTGLGLAIHAGQVQGALPAGLQNLSSAVVLAGTVIATALLLGLVGMVGLVGLVRRRARGARDGG